MQMKNKGKWRWWLPQIMATANEC